MRINEDYLDKINAADLEQETDVGPVEETSLDSSEWLEHIRYAGDYYLMFIYTRPVNEKRNGYGTVSEITRKTTRFLNRLLGSTPIENSGLKVFATQQTYDAFPELAEEYHWNIDNERLRDWTLDYSNGDCGLTFAFAIKRFDRLYDFLVLMSSLYNLCTMKKAPESIYVRLHWVFYKFPWRGAVDAHWHDNKYPLLKCRQLIDPKMRYDEMNPNFSMFEMKKFIQILSEREQDQDEYADWLTNEFQKIIDRRNEEFAQKKYYESRAITTGVLTTPLYEDIFDRLSSEDIEDDVDDDIKETDEDFEHRCLQAGYTHYTVWIIKGLHREMSPKKIIENIRKMKQRTEQMLDGFFDEHSAVSVIIPQSHIFIIDFMKSGLFGFDEQFIEDHKIDLDENSIVIRFAYTPDPSDSIAKTVRFMYAYHNINQSPLVNSNNGRYYLNAYSYIRNYLDNWVSVMNCNFRVICDIIQTKKTPDLNSIVLSATTIFNLHLSYDLYKDEHPADAKKVIRRKLEEYHKERKKPRITN